MQAPDDGSTTCPLCAVPLAKPQDQASGPLRLDCHNCGQHLLNREALDELQPLLQHEPRRRTAIAHAVCRAPAGTQFDRQHLLDIAQHAQLPPPLERIDNLLLFMAETGDPGEPQHLDSDHLMARLGAGSAAQTSWVLTNATAQGLVHGRPSLYEDHSSKVVEASLRPDGWKRVDAPTSQTRTRR